jgi:hypothetical protein
MSILCVFLVGQARDTELAKLPSLVGSSLTLKREDGTTWLYAGKTTSGVYGQTTHEVVELYGHNWPSIVRLYARDRRMGLEFLDAGARVLFFAATHSSGRGTVGVGDANSLGGAGFGIQQSGEGVVAIFDKEGRATWRAPLNAMVLDADHPAVKARERCDELFEAVRAWKRRHDNKCPDTLEQIRATVEQRLKGPENDPWGNPYVLEREGDRVYVVSCGPDGKKGTDDDIVEPSRD